MRAWKMNGPAAMVQDRWCTPAHLNRGLYRAHPQGERFRRAAGAGDWNTDGAP